MQKIEIFQNEMFGTIRTSVNDEGEPLFCLTDVAKALGYVEPARAVRDHCRWVCVLPTQDALGREQPTKFGKESEVYRLTLKAKTPKAEGFQDWVCGDILPSLRKRGRYEIEGHPANDPHVRGIDEKWFSLEESKLLKAIADDYKDELPKASQAIMAHIVFNLTGERLLPCAKTDIRYTASDIAKEYRVYHTVVGKVLKHAGIQTAEYGELCAEVTRDGKQVSVFQYNGKGYERALEVMDEYLISHPSTKRLGLN